MGARVGLLLLAGLAAALVLAGPGRGQTPGYALTFMCGDPYENVSIMRLRNPTDAEQSYGWRDQVGGQISAGKAPAGTDTFFYVKEQNRNHTVVLKIGNAQLVKATNSTNLCTTKVTVEKTVEGATAPAGQRFPFELSGTTGFDETFELAGGESREFTVPATIKAGSIPIGQPYPGGYAYRVRELESFGATVEATNADFTASKDGKFVASFVNRFDDVIPTPTPTPPPSPSPSPQPPQPPAPAPPAEADLALTKTVSPTRGDVGEVFTFTVTVTNRGPATATNVLGTEATGTSQTRVPVEVLGVETSPGVTCSPVRPIGCGKPALAPGETVTVTVRTRQQSPGVLSNVAAVSADQPDPNPTNNRDVAGIEVTPGRAAVRVSKRAARSTVRAGGRVRFTTRIRASGPDEAVNGRICDRPPSGLGLVRAPLAVVSRGRACRFFAFLAKGAQRTLTVQTRVQPSARGRRITNRSTVSAQNVRPRRAAATVTVAPAGARFTG